MTESKKTEVESLQETKFHQTVLLVCRQTGYTQETAREKLIQWDNNYLNVIKEYMNPDFQKVVAENKKHTTNQMVFKEIRGFMDGVNEGYEKRKKQKEDEQLKKQQFAAYFNNRINTRIEEAKKIWDDAPEACWVDKEVVPLLMKFDFTDQNGVSGKTFCDYYFTPIPKNGE